jgi:predicted AAA+ superfamily ATPase
VTCLAAVPSLATETQNRVVAIVNNQIITLHELNKTIKEMTGHSAEDLRLRNEEQFLDARRQILTRLIDERIAEEKIKTLNINVGDRHIDAAIEKIKRDNQLHTGRSSGKTQGRGNSPTKTTGRGSRARSNGLN